MLLSSSEPQIFLNKINKLLNERLSYFLQGTNHSNLDLTISFFVDGLMLQVLKYFRDEAPYTLDEISIKAQELFQILFIKK